MHQPSTTAARRFACGAFLFALTTAPALHAQVIRPADAINMLLAAGPTLQVERLLTTVLPNSPINVTPRGVGFDGVAALLITRPDGTFICTGSLLGTRRDILTAAHCLSDDAGNVTATNVDAIFFPSGQPGSVVVSSTSFRTRSEYTGNVIDDNDIALIRLDSRLDNPGIETYNVWNDPNSIQTLSNFVGFGASGLGSTGVTQGPGTRRSGFNTFDFFNTPGVLISDFDNGNPLNDASCLFGICNLGLGDFEVGVAGGDSGGPAFIEFGGQRFIAGVASFGASIGSPPDIDFELNASFGELSGHVFTGIHADWISQNIVPEPASMGLLLLGALMLGVSRFRSAARS